MIIVHYICVAYILHWSVLFMCCSWLLCIVRDCYALLMIAMHCSWLLCIAYYLLMFIWCSLLIVCCLCLYVAYCSLCIAHVLYVAHLSVCAAYVCYLLAHFCMLLMCFPYFFAAYHSHVLCVAHCLSMFDYVFLCLCIAHCSSCVAHVSYTYVVHHSLCVANVCKLLTAHCWSCVVHVGALFRACYVLLMIALMFASCCFLFIIIMCCSCVLYVARSSLCMCSSCML